MTDYTSFFAGDGPLASHVEGFAPRPQQQAMAEAVGRTLDAGSTLAVEAGTGIGKTFAYLVPALLAGRRVIISTGTRNLQDQLFHRDLPTVASAIGVPASIALLKGRANYLCLHRLALAVSDAADGSGGRHHLGTIATWARHTESGDTGELTGVPEGAPVWPRVTSTSDNCLGTRCDDYEACFVVRARRQAQEADVVVVNHYLLLADFALKEEGFGDLLPPGDAVILDEAHQVPEIAPQFFGISIGTRQLSMLSGDIRREAMEASLWTSSLEHALDSLLKATRNARLALPRGAGSHGWERLSPAAKDELDIAEQALADIVAELKPVAEATPGLETCLRRGRELHAGWLRIVSGSEAEGQPPGVRWMRTTERYFSLNLTPLDTSEQLAAIVDAHRGAWIFTSATLAVGDDFSHFTKSIGTPDAQTLRLDSPFDFKHNALLYLPADMPEPSHPQFTRRVCETALPLLRAAGGGAFLLFTSHRALQEAADWFASETGDEFEILEQGSAPRDELLVNFRRHGDAVLLGTGSFWEGVDVRGTALRMVIIDKLPFASPSDPVFRARLDAIRRSGGNPFIDMQVPQAVIALKQGAGRLIRDVTDRGLLTICDRRISEKSYGRVFLKSLPAMPITADANEAQAFAHRVAVAGGVK